VAAWLLGGAGLGGAVALDPAKVMVAPFENLTGDRTLDPIAALAADAVTQGLIEVGEIEVAAAADGPDRDDSALRAAARKAGAGTLVSGSYYLADDMLDLRGRVTDVASGKPIFALRPERGPRAQPIDAIDRVRQRVMAAMMLRLGRAPALSGVTTPPLYSAYQEYLTGASFMGVDWPAVVQHFERAAEIDPEFWHPQLRLLAAYRSTGNRAKSDAMKKHLEVNQNKFGPTDRILMQYYDAQLAGQTLEAYRKARELLALAPDDITYMYGAAKLALDLNRPREAVECIGDIERIDWKVFGHWMQGTWLLGVAAFSHHLLGEHAAELRVAELGVRLYPDMLNVREDQVRALAALGRIADVDRVLVESLGIRARSSTPGEVVLTAAQELRAHGHADASRRVAARGAAWYAGLTGEEASPVATPLNRVECLWLAERFQEARSLAEATVQHFPGNRFAKCYRAVIAAHAGDRDVAAAADKEFAAQDDVRGRGNYSWSRACIAAQLGERDRAVELLRVALANGFNLKGYLHVYVFLEPLHGYPPFEELANPQG
jgi:tetratricopeptide (TPR) repeat protein/TolB-like protein